MLETEVNFPAQPASRAKAAPLAEAGATDTDGRARVIAVGRRGIGDRTVSRIRSERPDAENAIAVPELDAFHKEIARQNEYVDLTAELKKIDENLNGISQSVTYTEAYLSISLTQKIAAMMTEELALAVRASQETLACRRRSHIALAMNFILLALLAAEMHSRLVSTFASSAADFVTPLAARWWAGVLMMM
jgi:hypothetical protein